MDLEQDIYDLSSSSEIAVLRTLIDQGAISKDEIIKVINKKKEDYVTRNHKNKIYLDSQGRWRTYYNEPGARSYMRKMISKENKRGSIWCSMWPMFFCEEMEDDE